VAAVEGVMVSARDEVDEVLDALEAASLCGNAWGLDEEGMKMVAKKGRSELRLGAPKDMRRGLKIDAGRKHLHTTRLAPLPNGTRRLEKTSRKTRLSWGKNKDNGRSTTDLKLRRGVARTNQPSKRRYMKLVLSISKDAISVVSRIIDLRNAREEMHVNCVVSTTIIRMNVTEIHCGILGQNYVLLRYLTRAFSSLMNT
jgi:hypothetical protein